MSQEFRSASRTLEQYLQCIEIARNHFSRKEYEFARHFLQLTPEYVPTSVMRQHADTLNAVSSEIIEYRVTEELIGHLLRHGQTRYYSNAHEAVRGIWSDLDTIFKRSDAELAKLPADLPQLFDVDTSKLRARLQTERAHVLRSPVKGGDSHPISDQSNSDDTMPLLTREDVAILKYLQEMDPRLMTQTDIETGSGFVRKTVSNRLKSLKAANLVDQPSGPNKGTGLTKYGRKIASQLPN